MNDDTLLLIDLSALGHQIYHVSGNEPDPSFVSTQILARVRALSTEHPHAAICCDAPPYLRKEIDPSYKATRPETIGPLLHEMKVAEERLAADGYPVWKVPGFEADDVIATAVRLATAIDGASVLIASSDKDLMQLVGPAVTMKSLTTGNVMDEAGVVGKFGVRPDQMLDFLSMVGDVSDNIIGAKGIGAVTAAKLLKAHGTLAAIYEAMTRGVVKELTPAVRTSLVEFRDRWETVRALITLRSDVAIPFEEIAAERTVAPMEVEPVMSMESEWPESPKVEKPPTAQEKWDAKVKPQPALPIDRELTGSEAVQSIGAALQQHLATTGPTGTQRINEPDGVGVKAAPRQPLVAVLDPVGPSSLAPVTPVDFSQQLEPRSMEEAARLAGHMFKARLFNAYGTWEGVFSTILAGRELGLPAMASLRAFHIIESRPQLSADTIAALVLKSGKAKYFKCTGRSATSAAFKTLRVGEDEEPFELVYTIEEGRKAWKKDEKAWNGSSWGTNPADMLIARAKSKLARLVYPDVVGGLYAVEEMEQ